MSMNPYQVGDRVLVTEGSSPQSPPVPGTVLRIENPNWVVVGVDHPHLYGGVDPLAKVSILWLVRLLPLLDPSADYAL